MNFSVLQISENDKTIDELVAQSSSIEQNVTDSYCTVDHLNLFSFLYFCYLLLIVGASTVVFLFTWHLFFAHFPDWRLTSTVFGLCMMLIGYVAEFEQFYDLTSSWFYFFGVIPFHIAVFSESVRVDPKWVSIVQLILNGWLILIGYLNDRTLFKWLGLIGCESKIEYIIIRQHSLLMNSYLRRIVLEIHYICKRWRWLVEISWLLSWLPLTSWLPAWLLAWLPIVLPVLWVIPLSMVIKNYYTYSYVFICIYIIILSCS